MKSELKKVGIIGGGAAGMMAAATLLESNVELEVHLFEKNSSLGKKVIISGGGRCNVTTGITDERALEKKYIRGMRFFKPALANFPPDKVLQWFELHGVPLKTESDSRVFPVSDRGQDIVGAFENVFAKGNLHLHFSEPIKSLSKGDVSFVLVTEIQTYEFDFIVIATGGNAYRHTGSSGDGYAFAVSCGHSITQLGPSLNSFEVVEGWPKALSGISFPAARLETCDADRVGATGPFLFTHFGISGPVTFAFSAHTAFADVTQQKPLLVSFSPFAALSFEAWYERIQKAIESAGAKQIHSLLDQLLPKRFVVTLMEIARIKPDKQAATLSKEERKNLAHLLSGKLCISLVARRPGDEFVTAGGVDTDEINRKTMESKICNSLYFAGEVVNIDGVTGGFNLQVAWATGRLAGQSILKALVSR